MWASSIKTDEMPRRPSAGAVTPGINAMMPRDAHLIVGIVATTHPLAIDSLDGRRHAATSAAGQAYELCVNDEVLAVQMESRCWVLQVLRLADNPSRQFSVHGAASIRLLAEQVELKAGALKVHSQQSVFRLGAVRLSAKSVTAVVSQLHTWSRNWFLRAQVVATRARQRISRVDTAEVLRAGEVDVQVTGSHRMTVQDARLDARDTVSVTGSKVLLG